MTTSAAAAGIQQPNRASEKDATGGTPSRAHRRSLGGDDTGGRGDAGAPPSPRVAGGGGVAWVVPSFSSGAAPEAWQSPSARRSALATRQQARRYNRR